MKDLNGKNVIIGLILVIIIIAGFGIWGCNENSPTSNETTGSISGLVTKVADSTGISGATVSTTPATSTDITNISGQYTITGVNAGNYTVTAVKSGYLDGTISVTVTAGNITTANIALSDIVSNNPPFAPSNPSPANAATNINTELILSWICSDPDAGDTLKYDVYFGMTNPPTTIVSTNQDTTNLVQSDLANSTTYYWKVTAKDEYGATTDGPVWYFSTVSAGTTDIEWISIPSGDFTMGSLFTDPNAQTDEQPQHIVYLDAYQISKYEITNGQYKAFIDAGGYSNSAYWTADGWEWITTFSVTEPYWWTEGTFNSGMAFPNHPVVGVSWHEAYAFCQWIGGHLPTEAQWEKAARGTEPTNYWPWGSIWDPGKCNSYFNALPDTFAYSAPVGFFSAGQSPYAVYDLAGNVWEWVNDWYDSDYYSVSPYSNPTGPDTGAFRVFRGGGWGNIGVYLCRSADRRYHNQVGSNGVIGFRPAK